MNFIFSLEKMPVIAQAVVFGALKRLLRFSIQSSTQKNFWSLEWLHPRGCSSMDLPDVEKHFWLKLSPTNARPTSFRSKVRRCWRCGLVNLKPTSEKFSTRYRVAFCFAFLRFVFMTCVVLMSGSFFLIGLLWKGYSQPESCYCLHWRRIFWSGSWEAINLAEFNVLSGFDFVVWVLYRQHAM